MTASSPVFLIGFDNSNGARDALALGELAASRLSGRLVVGIVHQFDRLMAHAEAAPVPPYDFETAAREQAEQLASRVTNLRHTATPMEVRVLAASSRSQGLRELVDDIRPAGVIVGSSHRAAMGRTAPGSVGESLLSGTPCPVVVVPAGYAQREVQTLERLAVAYDGSDESGNAAGLAAELTAKLRGRLMVIAVCDRDEQQPEARHRAERLIRAGQPELDAETETLVGDAAEQLADASAAYDLLICGSRGHGPVRRVLLGSVTARLVRAAGCPVVVIPRGTGRTVAAPQA
jgi:nucleotide-binding universal stress UspA family protein